jgi:hypothetical protein
VNTVNSGDKLLAIVTCPHARLARFEWITNDPGEAPMFVFGMFPSRGLVVLSKNEVRIVCVECRPYLQELVGQHAYRH